jgi:hypothetical protein
MIVRPSMKAATYRAALYLYVAEVSSLEHGMVQGEMLNVRSAATRAGMH